MFDLGYLMEDDAEAIRLELKTDETKIEEQAVWAGIQPGMRVLDIGCGIGKTTYCLNKLVQPHGETVGIDGSKKRIDYANKNYSNHSISYICCNIFDKTENLGSFDFIWIRFFLEYFGTYSYEILSKYTIHLNSGGIICLIDLDNNCMNRYGIPDRLDESISKIIACLKERYDFDPNAGGKLYSYLYDLGCYDIDLNIDIHHKIYGELDKKELFNWEKKLKIAVEKSQHDFEEYNYDYKEFIKEFESYIVNPRRFIYTPIIMCRGKMK